ncbi:sodium:solute symporter family transporter, partial [Basilea psittacipulmonis]
AVMSTLSCQLLVSSSAITEDFYKGFLRPKASQKELVWIGRAMVLAVAAIAIYIARDENSSVLKVVSYAWAGFGAAFGPVVILSVFSKRISSVAAVAGMIVGSLVVVGWKYIDSPIYEIIPGFIACWIVTYVLSLESPASKEVQEKFEQADNIYRSE